MASATCRRFANPSPIEWLHDDWFLFFKLDDRTAAYCTESNSLWLAHEPSSCPDDCPECEQVWQKLADEYYDRAMTYLLAGGGDVYVPEEWLNPQWRPIG